MCRRFLCALHPDMRQSWAEGWAGALKPGGELVTLLFPVDPALEGVQGPPWPVTPELYRELLSGEGGLLSGEGGGALLPGPACARAGGQGGSIVVAASGRCIVQGHAMSCDGCCGSYGMPAFCGVFHRGWQCQFVWHVVRLFFCCQLRL
jgi:hypothetical protein